MPSGAFRMGPQLRIPGVSVQLMTLPKGLRADTVPQRSGGVKGKGQTAARHTIKFVGLDRIGFIRVQCPFCSQACPTRHQMKS